MKKIYSFVLMAAMLFMGTNAWAENEFRVGSNHYSTLQDAIAAAGDGATIYMDEDVNASTHAWLNAEKHIILDLQENILQINCTTNAATNRGNIAIAVMKGTLEIKNGTIKTVNSLTEDLIRVYGGDVNCTVDAKVADPVAHLIVNSDVELISTTKNVIAIDVYRPDQAPLFGQTATGDLNYTCVYNNHSSNFGFANGARIDVYGTITAQKYGIKVNGMVRDPQEWSLGADKRQYTPFVYVHTGAVVGTTNATSAVAAYSSGYGRWQIEGTCQGSTGLYAKSGDVTISNGTIASTQDSKITPAASTTGSGVSAGGSAIVIESNANYSGNISVAISGENTQITGSGGYAIEETISANVASGNEVEIISIQGGTFGGGAGAIIVEDETKNEVTVAGGKIDGTIQVSGNTVTSQTVEEFINGTTSSDPAVESDYLVVKNTNDPTDPNVEYTVTPNLSKVVTMNGEGYATFSAAFARQIVNEVNSVNVNDGLVAYYATSSQESADDAVLSLTQINDAYGTIPANTGVIFKGEANRTYALGTSSSTAAFSDNLLKAATDWSTNAPVNGIIAGEAHEHAYVLVGEYLYKYTGANMKEHKAYLDLNHEATPYGAPQRIRMVIAQEEQTEAVERVETESVKAVKFVENGEILIRRGENVYNLQGQIVK